jgi:hypothetical protein
MASTGKSEVIGVAAIGETDCPLSRTRTPDGAVSAGAHAGLAAGEAAARPMVYDVSACVEAAVAPDAPAGSGRTECTGPTSALPDDGTVTLLGCSASTGTGEDAAG